MAATLYGTLAAPKWGCTDESALGIVVNGFSSDTEREETTLPNGQNDIAHAAYSAQGTEATCDFKVANIGYPTEDIVGGVVTITDAEFGGDWIVKSVNNTKSSDDFFGGSMTLRQFPGFSYSTTSTTSA